MNVIDRKITDLIPAEYNPRYISDDDFEQLKASIKRFEAVEPVIVNMHDERKNIIISGHQRIKAAKSLGMDTFPCIEVNLSKDKERELNIRMNKNTGSWDWDELSTHFDTEELTEWGFTDDELFGKTVEKEYDPEDLSDELKETLEVIMTCRDEKHQEQVYNKMIAEGYECRVLTL